MRSEADSLAFASFATSQKTRLKSRRTLLKVVVILALAWPLVAWIAAKGLIVSAEEVPHADAIFVLSNTAFLEERSRRAAELFHAGRAPKIVLTNENQISRWSESQQRNLYTHEWEKEELRRVGVSDDKIDVINEPVTSTYSEAVRSLDYAQKHQLKSLLVVTSAYHSRRALWTFRQVFSDSGIAVAVEPVATGQQTPQPISWWFKPSGWKTVATEYPKLVYYWVRYRSAAIDQTAKLQRYVGPEVKTAVGANQAGMVLSVSAPVTAYMNEVLLIDARKSTGVPNKPQSDGTPSVTVDFGDGITCNLLACGHAYRSAGTYTITVSAKNRGAAGASVSTTIQVADVPAGQNVIDMTSAGGNAAFYVAPNSFKNASANAKKLQAAINLAATRNTVEQEIVLPAGAVFAGPIYLPTPVGGKYITIRSSSLASMPVGNRVGPGSGSLMPVITAPSSSTAVLPALGTTVPAPASPPHHYRIQGIHLRKDDETKPLQTLLSIGTDSGGGQTLISKIAHHFIVERCWFNGGASDSSQMTNGVRIYANTVSLMDNYVGEMRLIGTGVDAAAISLTTGEGPYAFWNNTMIATSENFNIAGGPTELNSATISNATTTSASLSNVTNLELDENIALPVGGTYGPVQSTVVRAINGNTVSFDAIPTAPDNGGSAKWGATPSYIEFRGNYLYKPLKWWPQHPSWNGITYQIKNLWETKFSRYVVVDGNVMENSWIADQAYAIVLTVRNQNGGESAAAVVREMQWSNNIIRNAGAGINILSDDYFGATQRASDITFRNNLFQNVGSNFDATGAAHMLINMQNSNVRLKRIFLIHNTHDNGTPDNTNGMITDFGETGGADESMWLNNVHQHGGYGFRSNANTSDSEVNIRRFLPNGGPAVWNKNLVANIGNSIYPARPRGIYPSGSWPAMFVNYAEGDFTLTDRNPGKNAAADGTDMGVNMMVLRAATQNTETGQRTATEPITQQPTPAVRPRVVKPRN